MGYPGEFRVRMSRKPHRRAPLAIESLEDRKMLAGGVVTAAAAGLGDAKRVDKPAHVLKVGAAASKPAPVVAAKPAQPGTPATTSKGTNANPPASKPNLVDLSARTRAVEAAKPADPRLSEKSPGNPADRIKVPDVGELPSPPDTSDNGGNLLNTYYASRANKSKDFFKDQPGGRPLRGNSRKVDRGPRAGRA